MIPGGQGGSRCRSAAEPRGAFGRLLSVRGSGTELLQGAEKGRPAQRHHSRSAEAPERDLQQKPGALSQPDRAVAVTVLDLLPVARG